MSREESGAVERTGVRGVAIGDTLGRCLLTELLGRGGCCTVFRALHQSLNVAVAVKVLQLDTGAAHRRAYEQLRSEARLLAQIDHPHVVRILDFEDDPEFPYLVLECVEGPSLADLIRQSGRLSLERAAEVIDQAASALAAVWALGAVHRDVKPGNLLLTRGGTAKLADFGQAMLIEDHELRAFEGATPADEVAGTAAYVAPEQFLAPASVDHRADIYALGSTLYQAVTGQTAFSGRSRMEVMHKQAKEDPPPPHDLVPELGPAASEVILTMLAKDAADRYQNATELRDALARLKGKSEPAPVATRVRVESSPAPEEPAAEAETSDNILTSPRGRSGRSLWRSFLTGLGGPTTGTRPAGQAEYMNILKRSLGGSGRRPQ